MLQFLFNNRVTHRFLVNYLIISHNQKNQGPTFWTQNPIFRLFSHEKTSNTPYEPKNIIWTSKSQLPIPKKLKIIIKKIKNKKTKSNPNLVFCHVHRETSPILHHFREKNLLTQISTFFMAEILLFNHFLSLKNFSVITTKKLVDTNGNTDRFFSLIFCCYIYWTNFSSITKPISKYQQKYVVGVYRGNHNRNRRNKKIQTMQWHVSFYRLSYRQNYNGI